MEMENGFNFADFELQSEGGAGFEKIEHRAPSPAEAAFAEMRGVMRKVLLKKDCLNPFGEIFYRQGKIIEFLDAEYNENYIPEFYTSPLGYYHTAKFSRNFQIFHPCYQDMTSLHLKYYLWWRNEFRNGLFHKTTVSYLKLYAFELVNGIGGLPPKKTLARLIYLWKKMKEIEPHCDYLMMDMIKSYYCVNDLKSLPYDALIKKSPYAGIADKQPFAEEDYANIYKVCEARLTSKTLSGSFRLSRNGHFIEECLPSVFRAAEIALNATGIDLKKLLTGAPSAYHSWLPFRNVPYYSDVEMTDRRIDLSPTSWIVCENGRWISYSVMPNSCCFALLAYIYRLTECTLREQTAFPSKLRPSAKQLLDIAPTAPAFSDEYIKAANSMELSEAVSETVKAFLASVGFKAEEKRKNQKKATEEKIHPILEIEFDFSKLDEIRSTSDYLCDKLVIDEDAIADADEKAPDVRIDAAASYDGLTDENAFAFLLSQLDETQKKALSICLDGGHTAKALLLLAKENNTMPSVLIEEINGTALDIIGDIIIENGENPLVVEDYADELRRL